MASLPLPLPLPSTPRPVLARDTSSSSSLTNFKQLLPTPASTPRFRRDRRTLRASTSAASASFPLGTGSTTKGICEAAPSVSPTLSLREICGGRVPEQVLQKAEEVGYIIPTTVQQQSLPILLSGKDCILHAQTGSGKTLAYLLSIFSAINIQKSAVQALIVVPTRELGIQVTKVARILAAKPKFCDTTQRTCTIMALLDGGMLKRHKSWLKAEPPGIVVATIASLFQMLEKHVFDLDALQVLVIDEVDFMFYSSKQVFALRKLLTSYSSINSRQTIFASATIPQHNRFLYDCIQQKWTKSDAVHIHVNPVAPMPSNLSHKFVITRKRERLHTLLALLQNDAPKAAIIFVGEQSEKSKRAGEIPLTILVSEFLKSSYRDGLEVLLLEEDMNFNARATSLSEVRQGCCLLVATDLAGRGVDLPDTSHIYNFDLPKTAVSYLHRAGRTGRKPFSEEICTVTSFITPEERFVLQKFENELMFHCEELSLKVIQ